VKIVRLPHSSGALNRFFLIYAKARMLSQRRLFAARIHSGKERADDGVMEENEGRFNSQISAH